MSDVSLSTGTALPAEDELPVRRIIAFTAMVFGMFMALLDIQIVTSALADIQAGLSAGRDEIAWVQTAYLIAEVVMIPLSGILARILSTRVMFTISAAGFTLASALASTATNLDQMIVYRALQGFIGGGMIPSVFAAAFTIFPPSRRAIVSPIIGLVATLAPTIGPTVGGYISDAMSWHWLFLINVVPGVLVAAAAWSLIDFDEPEHNLIKHFDWWGLLGMAAFLGGMEYVLEEGPGHDWLGDQTIAMFAVVMVLGGILFFARAFLAKFPVVDLTAFQNVNFAFGSLFSFVLGMGLYGLTYLFPLYLGSVRGYSALMIGETVFVSGAAMFLTAPVAGLLSTKMDMRVMLMIGFAGLGSSTFLMTSVTADWAYYELLAPQILRGISLMLCMVPINGLALGTLPPERMKNASGLFNLTRNLGGAVGLAIINTILTKRDDFHYERLAEGLNWANGTALQTLSQFSQLFSSHGLSGEAAALAQLTSIVRQQAWVMSFADVFWFLTIMFTGLALGTQLMKKPGHPVEAEH